MKYTKPMNIRLEKEIYKRLKMYAESQNAQISDVVRGLIYTIINPEKKLVK